MKNIFIILALVFCSLQVRGQIFLSEIQDTVGKGYVPITDYDPALATYIQKYMLLQDYLEDSISWASVPVGLHDAVTLAGSYDYITLSGQVITRNQIDLTTDVTGLLPYASLSGAPTLLSQFTDDLGHIEESTTISGEDYLTLNTYDIVANPIDLASTNVTGVLPQTNFDVPNLQEVTDVDNNTTNPINIRDGSNNLDIHLDPLGDSYFTRGLGVGDRFLYGETLSGAFEVSTTGNTAMWINSSYPNSSQAINWNHVTTSGNSATINVISGYKSGVATGSFYRLTDPHDGTDYHSFFVNYVNPLTIRYNEVEFPTISSDNGENTIAVIDGNNRIATKEVSQFDLNQFANSSGYVFTDNQTVDNFSFAANTITLELENDGEAPYTIDLSSLDNSGTDDQTLQEVLTSGNDAGGLDAINFAEVEADEFIGDLRGAVLFKAQAGETLAKGEVVYVSGISGNTTIVSKADADDAAKMPAFGVVAVAANSGNPVDIYTFGTLSNLNTLAFSLGDILYVSTTAGQLTATPPTGESALLQNIAKVTRVDNAAGSIKISGAGRTNATPNLNTGRLFVGNASNQAVADGTIYVDIANSEVGIGTNNPLEKFHVLESVSGDVAIFENSSTNQSSIRISGDNTAVDYLRFIVDSDNNYSYWVRGSDITTHYDNSDTHIWRTNGSIVKATLNSSGLDLATVPTENTDNILTYGSTGLVSQRTLADITAEIVADPSLDLEQVLTNGNNAGAIGIENVPYIRPTSDNASSFNLGSSGYDFSNIDYWTQQYHTFNVNGSNKMRISDDGVGFGGVQSSQGHTIDNHQGDIVTRNLQIGSTANLLPTNLSGYWLQLQMNTFSGNVSPTMPDPEAGILMHNGVNGEHYWAMYMASVKDLASTSPTNSLRTDIGLALNTQDLSGTKSFNPKFTVRANGDVIVGDTLANTTAKFEVNGQMAMRTGATNGYVITGDADGLMSWTNPSSIIENNGYWDRTGTTITEANTGDDLNFDSNTFFVDASTNRVGIGISSPSEKLEVNGAIAFADNFNVRLHANNGSQDFLEYDNAGNVNLSAYSGRIVSFKDGSTTNMTILGTGNVGIGTQSPSATLDVNGDVKIATVNPDNTTDDVLVHSSDGTVSKRTLTSIGDEVNALASNDIEQVLINGDDANGENILGLNLMESNAARHPHPTSGTLDVSWENDYWRYRFGGTATPQGIRIDNYDIVGIELDRNGDAYFAGDVGIGTSSPDFRLEVVGDGDDIPLALLRGNGSNGYSGISFRDELDVQVGNILSRKGADVGNLKQDGLSINAYTNDLTLTAYNGHSVSIWGSSTSSTNNSVEHLTVANNGNTTLKGTLNIQHSPYDDAPTLMIGADAGSNKTTITNNTSKRGDIGFPHYHNSEKQFLGIIGTSNGTDNSLIFGGGSSFGNAATRILFFTATNDATLTGTERMRITSDGDIGIGTSPTDKLQIDSKASSNANYGLTIGDSAVNALGETAGIKFKWNTAVAAGVKAVLENVSTGAAGLSIETSANGSILTERVRIDKDGNVGIGTNLPTDLLHTKNGTVLFETTSPADSNPTVTIDGNQGGSSTTLGASLRINANIDYRGAGVEFTNTANANTWYAGRPYTGNAFQIGYDASGTNHQNKANSFLLINTSGNVGIGASSPSKQLTIQSNGNAESLIETTIDALAATTLKNADAQWRIGVEPFDDGLIFRQQDAGYTVGEALKLGANLDVRVYNNLRVDAMTQDDAESQVVVWDSGTNNLRWRDVSTIGDGNGIFDGTNDGSTVPTAFDVGITDDLNFASGLLLLDNVAQRRVVVNDNQNLDVDFIVKTGAFSDAFFLNGNNGQITLGRYGTGAVTGTETYILGVETDGRIVDVKRALGTAGNGDTGGAQSGEYRIRFSSVASGDVTIDGDITYSDANDEFTVTNAGKYRISYSWYGYGTGSNECQAYVKINNTIQDAKFPKIISGATSGSDLFTYSVTFTLDISAGHTVDMYQNAVTGTCNCDNAYLEVERLIGY